ncbi:uncharacterized protein TM35_000301710 [Trypanosoma theileri]|uniref:Uncharacterized protein n=1 Tax=Trypanosoma theileri TaxID=67003 RepID=A0A1X0NNF9_9TRYP|nr:uncharacterized protein TM35_000301710 [Trypanosoma theileri]ORC86131.1 hypothetical protein TM35_000301710 [Trypanosoma theileri]
MTTMFVQLRRVVYLLVLLQCFACVACAENASGMQGVSTSRSRKDAAEVERFRKTVVEVYKHFLQTRGCLSVLKGKRQLTENNSMRAGAVAKNIIALVTAFMKLEDTVEGRDPTGAWIGERRADVQQYINDFKEVTSLLLDISLLSDNCGKQSMVSDGDGYRFDKARKRFLREIKEETPEIIELRRGSRIVSERLIDLVKDLKSSEGGLLLLEDVRKSVKEAEKAMQGLKWILKKDNTLENLVDEAMGEDYGRRVTEVNATVISELEEAKQKEEGEIRRRLQEAQVEEKENEIRDQEGTGVEEQPSTGMEVTQEVDANVQGVQKKEEKQVDSESAGMEEVVGVTAKEEQKEEIRKEDALRQGVKIKEEANVTEIEAVKAVKAIQESDGSSGPALVHSPLLLLLLCVLGCTLVC